MGSKEDQARLAQLCSIFDMASSPDNNVQRQVLQALEQWSNLPEFNMFLAKLLAGAPDQSPVARQRAGLLLKTNITQNRGTWTPAIAEYVQTASMAAVRDPVCNIRRTAGSVITAVVQRMGIELCMPALEALTTCLTEANTAAVEGSFDALTKICEDGVAQLRHSRPASQEPTQPFVSWSVQRLLPQAFNFASLNAPVFARRSAIECLNHFALSNLFNDQERFPELAAFASKYMETLGSLATDSNAEVLKEVCRGFVCVLENTWACVKAQECPMILRYMLEASQHPEYAVRREALEVWAPCATTTQLLSLLEPLLPQLLPTLLANMVYTDADFMGMDRSHIEDDNAAIPDEVHALQPCFRKEDKQDIADDDEDDDPQGRQWNCFGAEWTARKAAASALDTLAYEFRFQENFLEATLPLIHQKLSDSDWKVQESGVLALGAIAQGCIEGLVKYLPGITELLIRLAGAPMPLLRSISCWTMVRFSQWICNERNPVRGTVLPSVLKALLQRILDRNKRVQEAACGSFATFAEEARSMLEPYLDDIVQTLVHALSLYQARNMPNLYDAVGTLVTVAGDELSEKPQVAEALQLAVMGKFEAVPDNDRSITPLFECINQLAVNTTVKPVGQLAMMRAVRVSERCVRLIEGGLQQARLWQEDPATHNQPDREVIIASLDLLSGFATGFGPHMRELLGYHNFTRILPEALRDSSKGVRQEAFSLVGDCANHGITFFGSTLREVVPLCAAAVAENVSAGISNNASWALGEISIKAGPEFIATQLDVMLPPLVKVLKHPQGRQRTLAANVCITLGRFAMVCGPQMSNVFGEFVREWCGVMATYFEDEEKEHAFQGLCNVVKASPQSFVQHAVPIVGAIASYQAPPPSLQSAFREILHGFRQALGERWTEVASQLPRELQLRLSTAYGVM